MSHKLTFLIWIAVFGIFHARPAHSAPGTVSLGWNACSGPLVTDLAVAPGQAAGIDLYCTVTGQADTTFGYVLRIGYGNTSLTVPDAWRFDAPGCQGSTGLQLSAGPSPALVKSCPVFQDAGGAHYSGIITNVNLAGYGGGDSHFAPTVMRILFANGGWTTNGVGDGVANHPVAGTTYVLMTARFDETNGVDGPSNAGAGTCGGLGEALCFNLAVAAYTNDTVGGGGSFQFHGGASGDWVTANAGGAGDCQGTPAHPATWGAVKAQYRN